MYVFNHVLVRKKRIFFCYKTHHHQFIRLSLDEGLEIVHGNWSYRTIFDHNNNEECHFSKKPILFHMLQHTTRKKLYIRNSNYLSSNLKRQGKEASDQATARYQVVSSKRLVDIIINKRINWYPRKLMHAWSSHPSPSIMTWTMAASSAKYE